ncbi:hypothetical protein BGZ68_003430 [Mortierella alpina]|nr:hypothetical protein BGZ68_003430 [Mortierella alpina]
MGQTNSTPSSSSSSSRHGRRSSSSATPSGTALSSSTTPASTASSSSPTVSSSRPGNNPSTSPMHRQQQQPPPQQPQQQQASSTSRLLRSTTERRRRANLFSSFYPLLSRGSSSNNSSSSSRNSNNDGNNSTSTSSSSNKPGGNAGLAGATDNDRNVGSSADASGAAPAAPQATAVVAASSSNTSATDSNRQSSGVGRPDWPSAPGSSSNVNARSTSRSPALQPSPLGGRTPRGLSRVQRMYDEQSIGSTRSSSRASSVVAVSPPANAPPCNTMTTLQHPPAEYMDIDPESVGLAPQEQQPTAATSIPSSDASQSVRPAVTPDHPSFATLPSHDATVHSSADQASSPAELARSRVRPDHELGSAQPSSAAGLDSFSPYERLLNPRGGTSISSSLLPIRPDSDDDDDMDLDHDQPVSSSASALDTPLLGHTRLSRTRRYPGPELVADLIHHQLMQSLRETIGVTEEEQQQQQQQQQHPPQQQQEDDGSQSRTENLSNSGHSSNNDVVSGTAPSEGAQTLRPLDHDASDQSITGLGLGQQPSASTGGQEPLHRNDTSGATTAQTPQEATTGTSAGSSTEGDAETPGSFMDRTQFLMNQLPFFMRLLTDLSRGIRLPDEAGGQNTEDRTDASEPESGSATNPTALAAAADTATVTETGTTSDAPVDNSESREGSGEAQTDTNAQPRRRNATIRFVQIGGGLGHALRNRNRAPGSSSETGEVSEANEATEAGETVENTNNENEGRAAGAANEDFGEAIILFLSGPSSELQSESDLADSTQDSSNDTTGARPRQRSPWIVLSLSGGYISSLLAAGANREGGASYDDLWMLSNLIGPARPLTTTQEAIDEAGFPVGRFEHAVQGIRDVATLGDGTRCLVCMSEYEEGEDMRALKCRHGFHQECIDKWLTTGANKCPVCRTAAVVSEPPAVEPEVSVAPSMAEE